MLFQAIHRTHGGRSRIR